MAGSS